MRSMPVINPGNRHRQPKSQAITVSRNILAHAKGHVATTWITILLILLGAFLTSNSADAAAGGNQLLPDETLHAGQSITGGGDALTMQGDGNLVLYAPGNTAIWATNTSGHSGAWVIMQTDGNLVVVAPNGTPLWATGTNGHSGAELTLQSDGNAVIYAPGNAAVWASNTYKQTYADIQLPSHGWGANQATEYQCLNNIWVRESNWNELAGNPNHAYGIPQANPGTKMAADGSDWLTNPQTQIRWGEDYIQRTYGDPCKAWSYWQIHHAY
jgi:hypothetical protein